MGLKLCETVTTSLSEFLVADPQVWQVDSHRVLDKYNIQWKAGS